MVVVVSFLDDVAKVKAEPRPTSEPIRVAIGDGLYELVFEKAEGSRWAATTAKHPMRFDQPIDRTYGYNFHAVAAEIAETTCTVTRNGEPFEMVVEKPSKQNRNPRNDWAEFFAVVDGSAYTQIADAVFALNQWNPDQRVAELGKAFRVDSEASSV